MLLARLALSFLLDGTPPTLSPTQPTIAPAPSSVVSLTPGPPKLLGAEIVDGGLSGIDKGVLIAFGPQGRRYELWQVHDVASIDHVLVLAYDAAGAELWRTKFTWEGGDTWSDPLAITVDDTGAVYFMYVTSGVANPERWRLVKVKPGGGVQWHRTLYTTTWGDEQAFLAPHPQGGVVVQATASGNVRDMYTARVAASGGVLWEHKFDVAGANQSSGGLAVAADGSIYAAGHDDAVRVRKYAADGKLVWTKEFTGTTQYERLKVRHTFLDRDGNFIVAGSTYAGGSAEDWYFVLKYAPSGARLRTFIAKVGSKSVKLFDYGLQGVVATHGPDDSVYFAWDHDYVLDSKWTLARVRVPGEDPRDGLARTAALKQPVTADAPAVVWTKTFDGDAAMNIERLLWLPNGAVAAIGRGKRKVADGVYRSDTRLRAVTPAGDDLGMAKHGSPGNFDNAPLAHAVDPTGVAYVLGWQYYSGDGWNDENVMRLRFSTVR